MSMPQLDAAQQAKLQLMQEMEIEMMSDLYSRMTYRKTYVKLPKRILLSFQHHFGGT